MSSRPLVILHPVLFGIYGVLYLYAENAGETSPADVLRSLVLALVGAAATLAAASIALRDVFRGAVVASALVVMFFFLYKPLAVLVVLALYLAAPEHVATFNGPILGIAFVLVTVLGVLGAALAVRRVGERVAVTNLGLTMAAAILLVLPLVKLSTIAGLGSVAPYTGGPSGLVAQRTSSRDIYYLILDQYGTNRALQETFGVTDNDLPSWLNERGFYVATDARANYSRTTIALPAVLSLDYLDSIASAMGPDSTDFRPLHKMIQDHKVGRFLREQGYQYLHLGNWYSPTSRVRIADRNLTAGGMTEFEATLYDGTALPALAALVDMRAQEPAPDQIQFDTARFQFASLGAISNEPRPGPVFVFAHILLPHRPYVFDVDGDYVPVSARRGLPAEQLYPQQLAYTNTEVKRVIQRLLARPEADQPIIIVQADEGPLPHRYAADWLGFDWATATPAEIQNKFGILDAFYLPHDASAPRDLPEPYPSISSVNTFRLIFDRYFGVGLPLLPDRSYVARRANLPYDLIDVTDRLGGP